MTKKVRVENADSNASFKVVVEVWNKSVDPAVKDTKQSELTAPYPADLVEQYIHSGQYLIVREA